MMRRVVSSLFASLLLGASTADAQAPQCLAVGKGQLAEALGAPELAKWLSLEVASCDGLVLDSDGVGFKLGETTLPVYGGNRAEVAVDFPFQEGDTVRYSWQMKLPTDFVADPQNRWWLLAQWHDQPDKRLGETWPGFPSRSPPVALYLEQRSGVPGMGVIFNGKDKRSWAQLPLGQWLQVSVTVHWSTDNDGTLTLGVADHPEFTMQSLGSNMHNAYQHYLKFGQYRHKLNRLESSVFFRNLDIQKIIPILDKK